MREVKDLNSYKVKEDNSSPQVPIWEKATLSIEEAVIYSNIGVGTLRQELRKPNCPFRLMIGNKYLIKRKKFEEFLNSRVRL